MPFGTEGPTPSLASKPNRCASMPMPPRPETPTRPSKNAAREPDAPPPPEYKEGLRPPSTLTMHAIVDDPQIDGRTHRCLANLRDAVVDRKVGNLAMARRFVSAAAAELLL